MPSLYLSPSTQEGNPYITGGSEEYYMNLLADELVPYLGANAIAYTRNTPDMTAVSSVAQANAGCYDLYLALHSNAAGPSSSGQVRGVLAFYYPTSAKGKRLAELIALNGGYPLGFAEYPGEAQHRSPDHRPGLCRGKAARVGCRPRLVQCRPRWHTGLCQCAIHPLM